MDQPSHHCPRITLPSSPQLARAKADLQLLELAIPLSMIPKRIKASWTPARRAIWQRTVRWSETSKALLGCLLVFEHFVGKMGLIHWYRHVLPSVNRQASIDSLSAVIIRLHALDSSIRWINFQNETNGMNGMNETNEINEPNEEE